MLVCWSRVIPDAGYRAWDPEGLLPRGKKGRASTGVAGAALIVGWMEV